MKPMRFLLLLLTIMPFMRLNAQQNPVYWELREDGYNNSNQPDVLWENSHLKQYILNNNNQVSVEYISSWNENSLIWAHSSTQLYNYNNCDSLSVINIASNTAYTQYYRTSNCEKVDSIIWYSENFVPGNTLQPSQKIFYTYDNNDRLINMLYRQNTPNGWVFSYGYSYVYNTDGLVDTEVYGYYSGNFENSTTTTKYYYNGINPDYYAKTVNKYQQNMQTLDYYTSQWDSLLYTYVNPQKIDKIITYSNTSLYTDSATWQLSKQENFSYFNNSDTDSTVVTVGFSQPYQNLRSTSFKYDINNRLYRESYYFGCSSNWCRSYRITYGYLPTSIEETKSSEPFILFPNPANAFITIRLDRTPTKPATITLYSALGQQVFNQTLVNQQTELPVNMLKPGLYFAVVNNSGVLQKSTFTVIE